MKDGCCCRGVRADVALGRASPRSTEWKSHPGDFGVQSATQPGPGFYAALFYLRYGTDTSRTPMARRSAPLRAPRERGVCAAAPLFWYVSKAKILGANYGAMVVLPFANASLEAPAFQLDRHGGHQLRRHADPSAGPGLAYERADIAAGLQVYIPTGRYEQGGSDNIGKGMWSYEPFLGAAVYFDEKRTFSLATTAYWEFHGKKEDTDVKVGQILTLQGGLGKSFLGGGLIIGAAYYAQWKVTKDIWESSDCRCGGEIALDLPDKHKVFGFGPDVTLPIATKSKLFALVNLRYLWETGARVKTQGQTFVVTATFPIPSVKLK